MTFDPAARYGAGLRGVYADADARDRLIKLVRSQGHSYSAADNIANYGLTGSGEGKLSAPFVIVEKVFPGSLPASAQEVGSCVAHSTRNAALGTLACEIAAGKPDEKSGQIEGVPEISEAARLDGVLSTEGLYWYRGHSSPDGWSCEASVEVACKYGIWLRKNYDEIGIDLTTYNVRNEVKWGRPFPPDNVQQIGREHVIRTATRATSFEQVRDLIANGYCITSCGGESFAAERDENGVSSRTRGGWAHAMAYLAADDRDETKRRYNGEPLIYVQNSWGPRWGSGGRRVMGTDIDIPLGGFWARWSDIKNRSAIAFSGVDGWPPQSFDRWFRKGML